MTMYPDAKILCIEPKIFKVNKEEKIVIGNRNLPQSIDWKTYRSN